MAAQAGGGAGRDECKGYLDGAMSLAGAILGQTVRLTFALNSIECTKDVAEHASPSVAHSDSK
jgi:hypothetical protein